MLRQQSEEKSENKYVQRDLEDQIAEEKGLTYKKTEMSTVRKQIKTADVVTLLKEGYTRYAKDDLGFGSIQAKYSLTFSECKELFAHDDIKRIKVKVPTLDIIGSDSPTVEVTPEKSPESADVTIEVIGTVVDTAVVDTTHNTEKDSLFS